MTSVAVLLILIAAVMHATWNLLMKHTDGGIVFVWLFTVAGVVIYLPVAVVVAVVLHPHIGAIQLWFLGGSAVLHLAYFVLLQRGYSVGDLSLVYPLARGTGPLLSTAIAIALFGERPTSIAIAGTLLIVGGVVVLTSNRATWHSPNAHQATMYGLLTGATIAAYTLWDKQAVSTLMIPPILLDWCSQAGLALLLTPYMVPRWAQVREEWRIHWRETLGVGVLEPLAYILVLSALVFTPVSYVAPAREISILIGTFMGTRLLAERQTRRRLVAAAAMVLGIVALVVP